MWRFKPPATVSSNVTFTLPSADGTANQALKTDASGNLGFASFLLATETTNGQVVTGGVRGAITTLTDAATIALLTWMTTTTFKVTLAGTEHWAIRQMLLKVRLDL